jgi:hypothetical protein
MEIVRSCTSVIGAHERPTDAALLEAFFPYLRNRSHHLIKRAPCCVSEQIWSILYHWGCVQVVKFSVMILKNHARPSNHDGWQSCFCFFVAVVIDSGPRYEVAYPSGVTHFLERAAFHVSSLALQCSVHGSVRFCVTHLGTRLRNRWFIYENSVPLFSFQVCISLLGGVQSVQVAVCSQIRCESPR